MDREEILRRSRAEGNDEREELIKNKVVAGESFWAAMLMLFTIELLAKQGFMENWVPKVLILVMVTPAIGWRMYGYFKVRKESYLMNVGLCVVLVVFCIASLMYHFYG